MKRILFALSFLLAFPFSRNASCQEDYLLPFSLLAAGNNPGAGLAQADCLPSAFLSGANRPTAYISHLSRIGFIKENGHYALSGGFRNRKNAWALHYAYQGYSLLNTQSAGFSYARQFLPGLSASLSFACRFSNRTRKEEPPWTGIRPGLSIVFQKAKWGLAFSFLQDIDIGRGRQKEWNQAIRLRIGGNCQVYENLCLGADVEKDIRYPARFSAGLSYLFRESFLVMLQGQANPVACKIGFGYYHSFLQVEIAAAYHPPLGAESSIGIAFKFEGKRRKKS